MVYNFNTPGLFFIFSFLECGVSSSIRESGVVKIGGIPLGSSEAFLSAWKPTFENYLTDAVGFKRNPPIKFSLLAISLDSSFDKIESGELDFVYANPSLYSCLEAEFAGTKIFIDYCCFVST